MASSIGVFTPEQARLLWLDYQERKQLQPHLQQNFPVRRPIDEPSPHRVFIKNTEAETMPAYACVEVAGTVTETTITHIEVRKPTKIGGEYLFNSQFEIGSGEYGWAYRFGVVRMLGEPPTTPRQYRPIVGSYEIEEGAGPFVVEGQDDSVDAPIKPTESEEPEFYKVLLGRFEASHVMLGRSGSGGVSATAASTVTLYNESGSGWTLGSRTVSCWAFPTAIVGAKDVMVFKTGSRLLAIEVC
jgi:hypothetical protein